MEAQWISGRVLVSRSRGCGFDSHRAKHINPGFVLVQSRKTRPDINSKVVDWDVKNQIPLIQDVHHGAYLEQCTPDISVLISHVRKYL